MEDHSIPNDNNPLDDFTNALAVEVKRILDDPLFQRSPVQSKLLQFLCNKAISGDRDLTQYAVAVDGLGKADDYDLQNDSYPRVQISRLRSNLANYYARNEPFNGQCVHIRPGDYRLRLAARDKSYPTAGRQESAPPEPDQTAIAPPSDEGPQAPSMKPPFIKRHLLGMVLGAVAIAAAGFLLWAQQPFYQDDPGAPSIKLQLVSQPGFEPSIAQSDMEASVGRVARLQLSQSFVSYLIPQTADAKDFADYVVEVDLGTGISNSDAQITLYSADNKTLFTSTVNYEDNRESFLREISAILVYLTSPNGVIAKRELAEIRGEPASPFQCFISIEMHRGRGPLSKNLLGSCIERFPDDPFAAFWYARVAYQKYQAEIFTGKKVSRSSPAWNDVQKALDIDRANAFANFVAAKVSVAEGECQSARVFIARAKKNGTSYPTLIAAADAEAGGCPAIDTEDTVAEHQNIEAVIESNPAPDSLLHLNMMITSLSIRRKDLADKVANLLVIDNPKGPLDETSQLMRKSLQSPQFFRQNSARLEQLLPLFVWNERARETIYKQLRRGA